MYDELCSFEIMIRNTNNQIFRMKIYKAYVCLQKKNIILKEALCLKKKAVKVNIYIYIYIYI